MRRQLEAQVRTGGMADFGANQLGRYLKETGERHLPGFTINLIQRPDRFLRGGDHLPFLNRGYAAVRFTEPFENFMRQHQNVRTEGGRLIGDLPEFVDFAYVADVARINAAGLASLAQAPAAPRNAQIETAQLSNDTTLRWDEGTESAWPITACFGAKPARPPGKAGATWDEGHAARGRGRERAAGHHSGAVHRAAPDPRQVGAADASGRCRSPPRCRSSRTACRRRGCRPTT